MWKKNPLVIVEKNLSMNILDILSLYSFDNIAKILLTYFVKEYKKFEDVS